MKKPPNKGPDAPPWGSKKAVNRAGESLRAGGTLTDDEFDTLEIWRDCHNAVLNTFQANLRRRTRGKGIAVGQRLKRRSTITDKLDREPKMMLARMDDIAGCRLIFPTLDALYEFRKDFLKAKFSHIRKNDPEKYDYIRAPKDSGYRGIHDVYEYNVNSKRGAPLKGLLLELQYRTKTQHAWATSVELVSQITDAEPKFGRGGDAEIKFFQLASEVLARTQEGMNSCLPNLDDKALASAFRTADQLTGIMDLFNGLNTFKDVVEGGNIILQFKQVGGLELHRFEKPSEATKALFKFEKDFPDDNIVLVNAETFDEIRSVYQNYFSDATEFITKIEAGLKALESE